MFNMLVLNITILKRNSIPAVCKNCGKTDIRILLTHHIDENHYNNELNNLAWMCHNCHYLVHHDNVEKQAFLQKIT